MPDLPTHTAHLPRLPRRRTLLAGVVIHRPEGLTTDCAVRDLSEGGAHIRLPAEVFLAKPIVLLTPSLDSACEAVVAWHEGRDVGLKFIRKIDLAAPASDLDRLARRLYLERSAR